MLPGTFLAGAQSAAVRARRIAVLATSIHISCVPDRQSLLYQASKAGSTITSVTSRGADRQGNEWREGTDHFNLSASSSSHLLSPSISVWISVSMRSLIVLQGPSYPR